MGHVPSRSMFGHAEAKPRQIDSVEYRFAASEDHRGDRKVQLINQPGLQILPHRENAAADLDVEVSGSRLRLSERKVP